MFIILFDKDTKIWNDRFYEKLINSRYHSVLHLSMWDASSSKKNELQRTTKALISLRGRAGRSAPLLFAHILRWVFSPTLAIDHAQVALLLYGQLFNGVLIYTHWNIGSTFVRGWIRNWIVVKVTFSKTVRCNEEWQIESVIKNQDNINMLRLWSTGH